MDPEDPDSAAVPLDSGIIFLTDEDLASSERRFLERQQQAEQKAKEDSGSSPIAVPVHPVVAETSERVTTEPKPSDGSASPGPVSQSRAEQDSGNLFQLDAESPSDTESSSLDEQDANDEEASLVRSLFEWVMVLVGAIVVAMLLRAFLFQAFKIPSESMESTLLVQDRVMVNRVSYHLHDVNRGDVVVFTAPPGIPVGEAHLIKRVIGLAGETIEGRDNAVYVNGQRVAEPYLDPADTILDFPPIAIPEGTVFVMGDNRDDSGDSRIFGPIETDTIVGRAFIIYWPLDRLDGI